MKKGAHFSAKGVAKMHGCQAAKEKEDWRDFSKIGCQVLLSKEVVLGHPCIPRVRVNTGGDKRPSLRKKGRDWYQGEGAAQIQGVKG